jgi:heme exporter protein C
MLVAYLLARRYGGPRRAESWRPRCRCLPAINVPLVYKSVDIWRTVHPKTTVVTTLDARMRIAFWSSFLLITLVWTMLLIIRMRLERARADLAALRLDAEDELAEGRP